MFCWKYWLYFKINFSILIAICTSSRIMHIILNIFNCIIDNYVELLVFNHTLYYFIEVVSVFAIIIFQSMWILFIKFFNDIISENKIQSYIFYCLALCFCLLLIVIIIDVSLEILKKKISGNNNVICYKCL